MRPVSLPVLLAFLAVCGCVPAASSYAPAELVARFQDSRISESSGLAGSRSSGYFFTHNDSGDGPVVYAVDRQGETLAAIRLQGAGAFDWEDMARAPGEGGKPALYLGDIGDNLGFRPSLTVYRIPEPEVDPEKKGASITVPDVQKFELAYEDGAHDAETLMVHPRTGRIYVVTKAKNGSGVYATESVPAAGKLNRLAKIAEIKFDALPESEAAKKDKTGRLLATGGDISSDGKRLVIRTYTDAWEWSIPGADVASAFKSEPLHVPLPSASGGEAISYSGDGSSVLATTEGKKAPIYELKR